MYKRRKSRGQSEISTSIFVSVASSGFRIAEVVTHCRGGCYKKVLTIKFLNQKIET